MEGVDYAFSKPSVASLIAAGKHFAGRYIGPGTDDKHLHAGERDALLGAGIDIFLLVEGFADSAKGGAPVGRSHGQLALNHARALGAPDSTALYFAVDYDVPAAQWPTVREYLLGAASVVGLQRVGVYGGIRSMQWAARDGVASWFFQTYAWSDVDHDGDADWYPGNHVEQYLNGVTIGGADTDLCRSVQPNFGQWSTHPPEPPPPEEDMTPEQDHALAEVWAWATANRDGRPMPPVATHGGGSSWDVDRIAELIVKADEILAKLDALAPAGGLVPHTHPVSGATGPAVTE